MSFKGSRRTDKALLASPDVTFIYPQESQMRSVLWWDVYQRSVSGENKGTRGLFGLY